ALKESEEKYRNVIERANDIIAIIQDYKVKFANNKVVDILGYKPEEVLNTSFTKFVHKDVQEILFTRYKQRFAGEEIENIYESKLIHKNGNTINVLVSGGIIEYEGKPADLMIIHDITKLKKDEAVLKESEEKYRGFFKTSTDCVFITTKEGKWIDMSDGAPEFFGYESKEELQKVNIRELYVNKSDREKDILEIEKKGTVKDALFNLRRKDGSIINVLISSVAIKDDDGNVVAFQGSIRDITAQKEAEITLKENQKYLQELNASKDKFFSIISHDLRSPFNSILGFCELLWKNSGDFSKVEIEKIAYNIYKTGNETIDLLNNLLEWSSSQTGKLKISPENFFLKTIVDDTIDLLNEFALKKNITVLNEVTGQIKVFADKNMISSVIRNLLSNAIKFTQNGNVRITAKDVNSFVEFSITDTGVGIKPEDINKLFRLDTEFSTKGTANEKGSGLGLILCKEFIEKNQGEINVKSEEGKGTGFMFKLPGIKNY
ncbi:MAG: PAS domain-containing sensor histidine kinase, partial [Bacteroidales bacterium]|nr:PAS domain-containing sensor histidine kinase [Bacteroidales bacterium]